MEGIEKRFWYLSCFSTKDEKGNKENQRCGKEVKMVTLIFRPFVLAYVDKYHAFSMQAE